MHNEALASKRCKTISRLAISVWSVEFRHTCPAVPAFATDAALDMTWTNVSVSIAAAGGRAV